MHQTKHNSLPFLKNKQKKHSGKRNFKAAVFKKGVIVIVPYIYKNL